MSANDDGAKASNAKGDSKVTLNPEKKKRVRRRKKKGGGEGGGGNGKGFVVFVGNLSYKTTKEDLFVLFQCTGEDPRVRLLTDRVTKKPRGCAFIEFASKRALQKALKLHHHTMDERVINVELSAGGGGTGSQRTAKIKTKNDRLTEQRKVAHAGRPAKAAKATKAT
eukprot:TRINITY_DN7311_c0_g1_i1.p1 TRINITY_DN7311_c0_g1~~TRINITY_DN7311_c0_g1_i1.p1  ORF type:complete len:167 (-),score=34.31 TRINITY_DN7311_c0_g1_i1:392-892(-)